MPACVLLTATYTDTIIGESGLQRPPLDIVHIFNEDTRETDVRRRVVGRLNGGAPQEIELRFRSPEAGLMPDDLGTFAAIGADTILTSHGPLELPAGLLSLIVEHSFVLIDAANGHARWMPGPELFWRPSWPPESAQELWPSFDRNDSLVWINDKNCFRLAKSGMFDALPMADCDPAVLRTLTDDEAQPIKAQMEAQGFNADDFSPDVLRAVGKPFYLRFPSELH